MSRQLSRKQATLLGAVVLAGVALAAWVLIALEQGRGFGGDVLTVEAAFADIGGVEVGARVRVQGIDAGEVTAIEPPERPGEPVKLKMRLFGKVRHLVTGDARVQVASDNLFAGRFVRIVLGTSPPAQDGDCLASLPPPVELGHVLARLDSALDDVDKGKGTLGMLAKDASLYNELTGTATEMRSAVEEMRKGQGLVGSISQDLSQSAAKLTQVLTRVDSALQDVDKGKGTLGMLLKDPSLYAELLGAVIDMRSAIAELRKGEGAIGKTNDDVRRLLTSVKQNSDAIKSLPLVRSYVVDAHKELDRPDCKKLCKWFPEADLFEPGRAVLTAEGRKRLDDTAEWFKEHKEAGSEVMVASFASTDQNADVAQTLTKKQSEAVQEYLVSTHKINRVGWWWWSTRSVRSIGVGTNHPALPGADKMPGSRIELLMFIPGA